MTQLADTQVLAAHRKTHAAVLGIGTADPPAVTQELTLELASHLAKFDENQLGWLKRVFLRSGIESRGSVLVQNPTAAMADFFAFYPPAKSNHDRGPSTAARMARYAIESPPIAERSARAALANAELHATDITHLITATCTGFFAPGLDAELIERLKLSRNVQRVQVGFMGCHAAFNALATATHIVTAHPKSRVLICCVELCSLHLAYGVDTGRMVANALFADGSASVVVGSSIIAKDAAYELTDFSSHLVPETRDAMSWTIGDHGFEMTLSPGVPKIIRDNLRSWTERFLASHGLAIEDVEQWAIHPGGPKILAAVQEALGLSDDKLRPSREILAMHGNMSSATVLYILQKLGTATGPCMAIGLGPGLMMEGMLLNRHGNGG